MDERTNLASVSNDDRNDEGKGSLASKCDDERKACVRTQGVLKYEHVDEQQDA